MLDLGLLLVDDRRQGALGDDLQLDLVAAARLREGGHVVEVLGHGLDDQGFALDRQPLKRPAVIHLEPLGLEFQARRRHRHRGGGQDA